MGGTCDFCYLCILVHPAAMPISWAMIHGVHCVVDYRTPLHHYTYGTTPLPPATCDVLPHRPPHTPHTLRTLRTPHYTWPPAACTTPHLTTTVHAINFPSSLLLRLSCYSVLCTGCLQRALPRTRLLHCAPRARTLRATRARAHQTRCALRSRAYTPRCALRAQRHCTARARCCLHCAASHRGTDRVVGELESCRTHLALGAPRLPHHTHTYHRLVDSHTDRRPLAWHTWPITRSTRTRAATTSRLCHLPVSRRDPPPCSLVAWLSPSVSAQSIYYLICVFLPSLTARATLRMLRAVCAHRILPCPRTRIYTTRRTHRRCATQHSPALLSPSPPPFSYLHRRRLNGMLTACLNTVYSPHSSIWLWEFG